jgi:hypothetical protein
MTRESPDPIVEYQARAILELEDTIRKLEQHRQELETTIIELKALVGVYQRSRAVQLATAFRGTPRTLRRWARSRTRKLM